MNILITRPLIDAEDLMGKLFSLGHKIIHIPTLQVKAVTNQKCDAKNYDDSRLSPPVFDPVE